MRTSSTASIPEGWADVFLEAQASAYKTALRELEDGHKQSCWIWFVLPQMIPTRDGRGPPSQNTIKFQIRSAVHGVKYLAHPVLGPRYMECIGVVHAHLEAWNRSLVAAPELQLPSRFDRSCNVLSLMGWEVDAHKLYMSLSTFLLALHTTTASELDSTASHAAKKLLSETMFHFLLNLCATTGLRGVTVAHIPDGWKSMDSLKAVVAALPVVSSDDSDMLFQKAITACHTGVLESYQRLTSIRSE